MKAKYALLTGGVPAAALLGLLLLAGCAGNPNVVPCVVDEAGVLAPIAVSADPAGVKALNAATAGLVKFVSDPACQAALQAVQTKP